MSVLRKGRKKMRKKSFLILGLVGCLSVISPVTALAESNLQSKTDLVWTSPTIFKELIREIEDIKKEHPVYTEDDILRIMNERHATTHDEEDAKGIIDIWNALTESEKKLCIRYPFDALKVNTAKNIATNQTEIKFGRNGLGDKSDAFRHGIWNAEMTILIGKEKAELFATAHEDKDVTGTEPDGFPKTAHRDMDLHNNEIGRNLGEKNKDASEDEMADIIYQDLYSETTEFVWLHE
jgi:hypothetical protein